MKEWQILCLCWEGVREVFMVRLCHKESAGFLRSVRDVTGLGIPHVRAWRRERTKYVGRRVSCEEGQQIRLEWQAGDSTGSRSPDATAR